MRGNEARDRIVERRMSLIRKFKRQNRQDLMTVCSVNHQGPEPKGPGFLSLKASHSVAGAAGVSVRNWEGGKEGSG